MKKVNKTEQEWKAQLTPEQYHITRQKGTEPAFTGKYYQTKDEGIYTCVCCGNGLFSSQTKYDSGSGWPSFWDPLAKESVRMAQDNGHGMRRVEVTCAACQGHLGHVFPDGPNPTGMRYCINSAALKLEKQTK